MQGAAHHIELEWQAIQSVLPTDAMANEEEGRIWTTNPWVLGLAALAREPRSTH